MSKKKNGQNNHDAPPLPRAMARRMDRARQLSLDAEVNRLADIVTALNAVQARVRAFRRDHPPGHRCRCCDYIRARSGNSPTVFDNLTAIETVLWSCVELSEEERPYSAREMEELDLRIRARLSESATE